MPLPCGKKSIDEEARKNLRKDLPIVGHEFTFDELKAEYGVSFTDGLTSTQGACVRGRPAAGAKLGGRLKALLCHMQAAH